MSDTVEVTATLGSNNSPAFERCSKVVDGLVEVGMLHEAHGAILGLLAVAEGQEERVQALAGAVHVARIISKRQKVATNCLAITKAEAEAAIALVVAAHKAQQPVQPEPADNSDGVE